MEWGVEVVANVSRSVEANHEIGQEKHSTVEAVFNVSISPVASCKRSHMLRKVRNSSLSRIQSKQASSPPVPISYTRYTIRREYALSPRVSLHEPSIRRFAPEGIHRPLLPALLRVFLVLFRSANCRTHSPSRLELLLFFGVHFLRPSPVVDALIPDIVTSFEDILAITMLEVCIHLFQRSSSSFRIQQYDERNAEDVESKEQKERAVADRLEQEGRDHRDDAITDRPANNGPCTALGTNIERKDLGWVKPWGCQPSSTENGGVEEGEGRHPCSVLSLMGSLDLRKLIENTGDEQD